MRLSPQVRTKAGMSSPRRSSPRASARSSWQRNCQQRSASSSMIQSTAGHCHIPAAYDYDTKDLLSPFSIIAAPHSCCCSDNHRRCKLWAALEHTHAMSQQFKSMAHLVSQLRVPLSVPFETWLLPATDLPIILCVGPKVIVQIGIEVVLHLVPVHLFLRSKHLYQLSFQ